MTSPGLSWDDMRKMTKINLDLISDIDMQLFIEKGLRGGISYIAHRHGKANNKYMQHDETLRGLSVSTSKECGAHGPPFLTYFYFNLSGNQRV